MNTIITIVCVLCVTAVIVTVLCLYEESINGCFHNKKDKDFHAGYEKGYNDGFYDGMKKFMYEEITKGEGTE